MTDTAGHPSVDPGFSSGAADSGPATAVVDLAIEGMTCAACAARIEKKLNRLPGVAASVNFAIESAHVTYDAAALTVDDLVRTVRATGYGAIAPAPVPSPTPVPPAPRESSREPAAAASEPPHLPPTAATPGVPTVRSEATAAPPWASTTTSETASAAPEARNAASTRAALRRVVVSAALTAPAMAIAMISALQFPGWSLVVAGLVTPVVTWCAWPFHRAALLNLRHGGATMDTLVSLGVAVSYLWSLAALATGGHLYFEVAAALTTFLLLGRFFEARARRRAGSALRAMLEIGAKQATVLRDGVEHLIPIADLHVDDLFVVRPGERVATDGLIVEGASAVDASLVTGESVPVDVRPGDDVIGGTVNANGRLVVRASRVGADTQLAQMARLVTEAQSGKAPVQRLADRVAAVFVPAVIVVSAVTFAGWLVAGAAADAALTAAVAVLIVACPCALGLATPTALLVGTGRAAALGIVIRGPQILEATRRVDTVVLDKTGTVTAGTMVVTAVVPSGTTAAELLRTAAAVEAAAEHPVARAIHLAGTATAAAALPRVTDFVALPGLGARGTVEGREVLVGRPALLAEAGITVPDVDASVAVAWDGTYRGRIEVKDEVRPTSPAAVGALRDLGLRPILLTGDSPATARAVADEVGIEDVRAGVTPAGKLATVEELRREGRVVAMVGDGVNDAAALAAADLGIAMGTGTDVAIQASDLTLVRADLGHVVDALRLARATLRTIKGNLFWAFAYNVAAIPLAAAGLVDPVVAAAAMALSSLFVVGNSLRLFRYRPA